MPIDGLLYPQRQPVRLLPAGQIELDRSHPLASHVTQAFPLNGSYNDVGRNRARGVPTAAPPFVTDIFGPVCSFNGTTQQVSIPTQPAFWDRNVNMLSTLSVWIRPTLSDYGTTRRWIVCNSFTAGTPSKGFGVYAINGNIGVTAQDSGAVDRLVETTPATLQAWHHVVMVYSRPLNVARVDFYLDGVSMGANNASAVNFATKLNNNLFVGSSSGANFFTGYISNLTTFNGIIATAAQVKRLYAEPFSLLRPVARRVYFTAPAGAGTTGTLAITATSDSIHAGYGSGAYGPGPYSAITAATGTVAWSLVTGTLTATQAPQTLVGTAGAVVRGTLTAQQDAQALVAVGGPVVSGTLTVTQVPQTLVAAAGPIATGTLAATQAPQTLVGAGSVLSGYVGGLNLAQAPQTLVAAGAVTGYVGRLSVVQAPQTLVAAGGAIVRGTLARTQAPQTISAAGLVLIPVTGTLTVTQDDQTLAAAGHPDWVSWQPCSPGRWLPPGSVLHSAAAGYGKGGYGVGPYGGPGTVVVPAPGTGVWQAPANCSTGTWTPTRLAA